MKGLPLAALLLFTACHDPVNTKSGADIPVVDVITAKAQSVSNPVEAGGTVVANQSVMLQPEASGRLIYLNVPEGRLVQAGTVIARLNDSDLIAQLGKNPVRTGPGPANPATVYQASGHKRDQPNRL